MKNKGRDLGFVSDAHVYLRQGALENARIIRENICRFAQDNEGLLIVVGAIALQWEARL